MDPELGRLTAVRVTLAVVCLRLTPVTMRVWLSPAWPHQRVLTDNLSSRSCSPRAWPPNDPSSHACAFLTVCSKPCEWEGRCSILRCNVLLISLYRNYYRLNLVAGRFCLRTFQLFNFATATALQSRPPARLYLYRESEIAGARPLQNLHWSVELPDNAVQSCQCQMVVPWMAQLLTATTCGREPRRTAFRRRNEEQN